MPIKVNGQTSGSVTVAAPATGSDVTLTLPGSTMDLGTELASKLPIAGGKILQVVRATDATERTTTSTSNVDANLSVTITPQKSDSAVVLIVSARAAAQTASATNMRGVFLITDNSNNAISGSEDHVLGTNNMTGSGTRAMFAPISLFAYATPATTSATTYKLRFRSFDASTTLILANASVTAQMYAIEVSA